METPDDDKKPDQAALEMSHLDAAEKTPVEDDDGGGAAPGNRCTACLRSNLLTILTVAGVVAGVALGFIMRASRDAPWSNREIMYVNFVGDLFLRMLKSLILPLIISSLISAVANLDLSLSGKVARRAILFYLTTTFFAVVLGIILVILIKPGVGAEDEDEGGTGELRNVTTVDTLLDLVRNMVPSNLVQACIQQVSGTSLRLSFARIRWSLRSTSNPLSSNSTLFRTSKFFGFIIYFTQIAHPTCPLNKQLSDGIATFHQEPKVSSYYYTSTFSSPHFKVTKYRDFPQRS